MEQRPTIRIKTISEFHRLRGLPKPEHPLISVVDYSEIQRPSNISETNWVFDFYQISLKRGINAKMKYGQQEYDFDEGVMFFISPNQVFRIEPDTHSSATRSGWMLLIHPDFFWNTPLATGIKHYEFFGYSVKEALFLSDKEERTLNEIIGNIRLEYQANIDRFSQNIIVSQVETLLNYAERFYNRQFIMRQKTNHHILERLEKWVDDYLSGDELGIKGLPTVQSVANALNVSSKYLSTLLKVLTGQTTQQHIHARLIEKAKEKLSTTQFSVSEIAYDLGFEHSQSFSKFFKSKTNLSPLEFRKSFN